MNKHLIDTHLNFLGTHKCLECDHVAENKHQLKRHVRWEHHGGKREECPKCSFVATKTLKLWPHWRTHHPNDEVLHCDMCGYITPLEYLMEVSKNSARACHISECQGGYFFLLATNLPIIPYFANGKNWFSEPDTEPNIHLHPGSTDPVSRFPSLAIHVHVVVLFQRHKTNIHSKTKIACPICGFETNAVNQLTKHIWLAHDKWNPHKCAYCTFKCGTEAQLRSHTDSEHDEKAMAEVQISIGMSKLCMLMCFTYNN